MTTSQPTDFLFEIEAGDLPIPEGKLAYFQERLRNNLYHFVVTKFREKEREGFTKALLARRLGSDPAVINRLLGAPGNWTLDTISNLLLGIAAEELKPASVSVFNRAKGNFSTPGEPKDQPPDWARAVEQKVDPRQSTQQMPPPFAETRGAQSHTSFQASAQLDHSFTQENRASTLPQDLQAALRGEQRAA